MMHGFKTYHPIVNFIYFVAVIGFSTVLMHPACLAVSLLCAVAYTAVLKGGKALARQLYYLIPTAIAAALLNPLFNHRGVTVLTYLPSGNPLTLESVLYGVAAAGMLSAVLFWFSCYNAVMTSDKFIYLFGKILPSLSLILSMTLRFVPRFSAQWKVVARAQKFIGRDASGGNFITRAKRGLTLLSVMVTWALENAMETADSMKSRGYGLPGRTAFSLYSFDQRDGAALTGILVLSGYVLAGAVLNAVDFGYFPALQGTALTAFSWSVLAAYGILCSLPLWMTFWEEIKWKAIALNG